MDPDYKAAYNILMDYFRRYWWDCIPEGERREITERLDDVLSPPGGPDNATITRALRRLGYERKIKQS